MEAHKTIGQDLVAMSVNDIITTGAAPLFFLDYFGTGALDVDVAQEVVQGIADACKRSDCVLLGGEVLCFLDDRFILRLSKIAFRAKSLAKSMVVRRPPPPPHTHTLKFSD